MQKAIHYTFVVSFITFLIGVLLVTAFRTKEPYYYYENRATMIRPHLSIPSVLDGSFFDDFEKYLVDHGAGRTTLIRLHTYADMAMRPVVNDVVITKEALLPFRYYEGVSELKIDQEAKDMARTQKKLADQVQAYGGDYLYVAVPNQYASYEEAYPWYLNNRSMYTRLELQYFEEAMAKEQVPFLDMKDIFLEKGTLREFSSSVDNHYSLFGAYLTYTNLIHRFNEMTTYQLEVATEDDVKFIEMPMNYLGANARKLLGLWQSDEKLIKAEFTPDIAFDRYNYGNQVDSNVYSMPTSDRQDLIYGFYMGGDMSEVMIDTKRPDLPTILVYGDSFTNAVEVVLYYSFDKMYSIDRRYYKEMSVSAYIDEIKPDYVVCIRDYEALLNPSYNGNPFE